MPRVYPVGAVKEARPAVSASAEKIALAAAELDEAMQNARAVWRDEVATTFLVKHHGPAQASLNEFVRSAEKLDEALSRAESLL